MYNSHQDRCFSAHDQIVRSDEGNGTTIYRSLGLQIHQLTQGIP